MIRAHDAFSQNQSNDRNKRENNNDIFGRNLGYFMIKKYCDMFDEGNVNRIVSTVMIFSVFQPKELSSQTKVSICQVAAIVIAGDFKFVLIKQVIPTYQY